MLVCHKDFTSIHPSRVCLVFFVARSLGSCITSFGRLAIFSGLALTRCLTPTYVHTSCILHLASCIPHPYIYIHNIKHLLHLYLSIPPSHTHKPQTHTHKQERPYHADRTTSRPLCEVKRRRARLVLRWGTTWEALVLFLFAPSLSSIAAPEPRSSVVLQGCIRLRSQRVRPSVCLTSFLRAMYAFPPLVFSRSFLVLSCSFEAWLCDSAEQEHRRKAGRHTLMIQFAPRRAPRRVRCKHHTKANTSKNFCRHGLWVVFYFCLMLRASPPSASLVVRMKRSTPSA